MNSYAPTSKAHKNLRSLSVVCLYQVFNSTIAAAETYSPNSMEFHVSRDNKGTTRVYHVKPECHALICTSAESENVHFLHKQKVGCDVAIGT